MEDIYRISYYAGVQTLRLFHRMWRFFTFLFLPLQHLWWRAVQSWRRRRRNPLMEKLKKICSQFRLSGQRVKQAWQKHPLLGILQALYLPISAVRCYPRFAKGVATVSIIASAVAVMTVTIRYWSNTTFALALDTGGKTWGYVADESVLQDGIAIANERIAALNQTVTWENSQNVTVRMVAQSSILDSGEVCDYLLSQTKLPLKEAAGVYIDGAFCGAVPTWRAGQQLLDEILEESCEGKDDVTASFLENVELVSGQYPESQIMPTADMKKKLLSQQDESAYYKVVAGDTFQKVSKKTNLSVESLQQLNPTVGKVLKKGQKLLLKKVNPLVRVLVSGTIEYDVETPFTVRRVADASDYEGNERIRVNGQNGKSRVTAVATYLDGVEQSCVIVSSRVIKEPVTQVIAYGTKKINNKYQGGQYSTGRFIWPTPCTRYITCYFNSSSSSRHNGIDIWKRDMTGEDILAADGGKVIVAENPKGTSYWSFGKYIIIDHGGGYQTVYAHCSELLVKEGDTVLQGQRIALVGNTGRSTSPHLHFEVRVNGRRVNPLKFY